jgi:hypothetical protein
MMTSSLLDRMQPQTKYMELSEMAAPLDGPGVSRGGFGPHLAPQLGETEEEAAIRENSITALVRAAAG